MKKIKKALWGTQDQLRYRNVLCSGCLPRGRIFFDTGAKSVPLYEGLYNTFYSLYFKIHLLICFAVFILIFKLFFR
jgi:hypothetical protein